MLLARFMLKRARDEYGSNVKDFAPRAVSLMKNYGWPGNVRELENRVKKAAVLCDGQVISPKIWPIRGEPKATSPIGRRERCVSAWLCESSVRSDSLAIARRQPKL